MLRENDSIFSGLGSLVNGALGQITEGGTWRLLDGVRQVGILAGILWLVKDLLG